MSHDSIMVATAIPRVFIALMFGIFLTCTISRIWSQIKHTVLFHRKNNLLRKIEANGDIYHLRISRGFINWKITLNHLPYDKPIVSIHRQKVWDLRRGLVNAQQAMLEHIDSYNANKSITSGYLATVAMNEMVEFAKEIID